MKAGKGERWEAAIFAVVAVGLAGILALMAVPDAGAQAQKEKSPSVEGASYVYQTA